MPRGVSPKREREYKEIEKKFEKEGRYQGREKEVAARIVNKQRAKAGETKKTSSTKRKRSRKKAKWGERRDTNKTNQIAWVPFS
jgi:hypothetical protein